MPFVLGEFLCNLPHRGHCDHGEVTWNVLANDVGICVFGDVELAQTVGQVLILKSTRCMVSDVCVKNIIGNNEHRKMKYVACLKSVSIIETNFRKCFAFTYLYSYFLVHWNDKNQHYFSALFTLLMRMGNILQTRWIENICFIVLAVTLTLAMTCHT